MTSASSFSYSIPNLTVWSPKYGERDPPKAVRLKFFAWMRPKPPVWKKSFPAS